LAAVSALDVDPLLRALRTIHDNGVLAPAHIPQVFATRATTHPAL